MIASQGIWYAERAAGVVAYLLLTLLVVLGLMVSSRVRSRQWPLFAVEDVHRFVSILAAVFITLHVSLLLVDTFVPFNLGQILIPFRADYRPLATGLGTVALELLVAVAVANAFRADLGRRTWHVIHYLGYGVWIAATAHGLLAGTDRHDAWLVSLYILAVTAVMSALTFRWSTPRPRLESALGVGLACGIGIVAVLALLPTAALA